MVVFVYIINPWHMREGYGSQSMCVCAFVGYHASCYIPRFHVENKGFLWHFPDLQHVAFAENALFKSSGITC